MVENSNAGIFDFRGDNISKKQHLCYGNAEQYDQSPTVAENMVEFFSNKAEEVFHVRRDR